MANSKKTKWKTSDYVRVTLLFFFQSLFVIALFIGAIAVIDQNANVITVFLTNKDFVNKCVYIFVVEILLSFIAFIYFYTDKRDFIKKTSNILMIFGVLDVSFVACIFFGNINMYLRPFALCSLLILFLVDKRSAIFVNCFFSILMLLFDLFVNYYLPIDIELYNSFIMSFIAGTLAVFIIDSEGSRLKVLCQGTVLSVPVIVSAVCLEFTNDLSTIWFTILYALLSGLLSDMIMMVIIPFFEFTFGALTNFRLAELTDHKSRLIKALIERAPGTFNHTLIVASLAEACSNAINLNPLLARACAYYHDIGKIKKEDYFAENQTGYNPHDELSPELSTDIIRAHAKDGAELIRKWRFPEVLAETAEQHHGTMPISYFYAKALKFTDGELDVEDYSYYGPKPKTKINAIIMICDACEAKVRTIGTRTHENVDKAVKEIIEERMDLDQFADCDITFRELDIIRNTITNALAGVYHDRVKYPKLKKGNKNAG
ncbi:MAG: HDIG domain-containing protein [Clostridia bacterium]|nr:HDIG domain-containing protein [Clostridia bacterium]